MRIMGRIRILVVVLTLSSLILGPTPAAHAGSVWDPNDAGHRLDIRWIGVYHQTDDRVRITVAFHQRVRNKWFSICSRPFFSACPAKPSFFVGLQPYGDRAFEFGYYALFYRRRHHGVRAALCEGGSGCTSVVRVSRPDKETMRVRLDEGYLHALGSSFRGFSFAPDGHRIDRTHWGIVT